MTVPNLSAPPALELIARNTASDSDNKIHDDAEARRYGYAGGLVPGVTLYAYLTRLAVETYGAAWLEGGTAECGFRRPVYEGERIRCEGEIVEGAALDLRVLRDGTVCAAGRAAAGGERESVEPVVPLGGSVAGPL
ncbi:MAG: hypothetical protein AB7N70_37445, partial [Dehalococcoidia bacterium]